MTNFIPIFPLDIVVYPGESLNLHIFEPRYKQLIQECLKDRKPFGLPSVENGNVRELGTLMHVTELVKVHETGELDIRTRGEKVFRILQVIDSIPEKLYTGAIVNYPANEMEKGDTRISHVILNEVKRLYQLLSVHEKYRFADDSLISYDIAHFVGLSKEEEYELISIFTEVQRLEYLRRHLNKILPVVKELEEMKARVQMNGHFRNLSLGGK